MEATTSAKTPVYSGCERLIPSAAGVRPDFNHEHVPDIRLLVVRSDPIKRNVKRKVLSIGPMPMFFSRHSLNANEVFSMDRIQIKFNPGVLLRPGFDTLRSDPRFGDLESRIGLPR